MFEFIIKKIIGQFCKYKQKRIYDIVKNSEFEFAIEKYDYSNQLPEIVVSLTSFPKRFDKIELCLKSISLQSLKPNRILIWLGNDTSYEEYNKYLKKYEKYGFEFFIDNENNYMSHKKYLYAFEKFKEAIIITLDDDLIYERNLIKSLVKKYEKYNNCIIARRVHKINFKDNIIENYMKWNHECFLIKKPSNYLFATTGAGTLFPPSILPKEILDFEKIKKYALTADDAWINLMAIKYNIKRVWVGNLFQMPPTIDGSQQFSLNVENIGDNKNDESIKKIIKDFNIIKENFDI